MGKGIGWGHLGNYKNYRVVGAKKEEETPLSLEERQQQVFNKFNKSWEYDPEKLKPAFGWLGAPLQTGSTPSVTATPTPSVTPTMTPTPSSAPFDSDAAAYLSAVITAGGMVDSTMSAATDTLFTSLKSSGLYNKLRVFYPMLGATSGSTSIMGKRVSGTTYDIAWTNVGSITFNASGVTGNGSTTYGDTNFNGYNQLSTSNGAPSHLSLYVGTDNFGSYSEMGTRTNGNWIMAVDYDGGYYGWHYQSGGNEIVYSNTDARGMYVQSRTSNSSVKSFRNGVEKQNKTYTETNPIPNSTVKLLYDGSVYSNRRIQFLSIGEGLDDTEAGNLTTIINTFQTSLGRNVY